MKRIAVLALPLLMTFYTNSYAIQFGVPEGFYAGAEVGRTDADFSHDDIVEVFKAGEPESANIKLISKKPDNEGLGGRIFFGAGFFKVLGVEIGVFRLGGVDMDERRDRESLLDGVIMIPNGTADIKTLQAHVQLDFVGVDLLAKASISIGKLYAFCGIGFAYIHTSVDADADLTLISSDAPATDPFGNPGTSTDTGGYRDVLRTTLSENDFVGEVAIGVGALVSDNIALHITFRDFSTSGSNDVTKNLERDKMMVTIGFTYYLGDRDCGEFLC